MTVGVDVLRPHRVSLRLEQPAVYIHMAAAAGAGKVVGRIAGRYLVFKPS